jgi:hypothetical protein
MTAILCRSIQDRTPSSPKATLTANSGSRAIGMLDSYQRLLERIQQYWGPL